MVIKKASPRPELGVAMVGHAFMGRAHSNAFRQVNHFFDLPYRVVPRVVVGRDAARAEAARDKFGFAESSTDLDAVLARDDIDVIDVATPNDSHHAIESVTPFRHGGNQFTVLAENLAQLPYGSVNRVVADVGVPERLAQILARHGLATVLRQTH